jgi:hypothetical protein
MIHEANVLKAISGSGISKIAIIDDAFDAPPIDRENAGDLLGFIEDDKHAAPRAALGIDPEILEAAKAAIEGSDFGADGLNDVVSQLYDRFVATSDEGFNPNGLFGSQAANIAYVRPILTLLGKCEPKLIIKRIGSDPEALELVDKGTHLIFIDFYLDRGVGEHANAGAKRAAKKKSLTRLKRLLQKQGDKAASVILMSWHDVEGEAKSFREDIVQDKKSLVFASRFGFLKKTELEVVDDGKVRLQDDAADTLLDIFQSYEFGRATHAALEAWLDSAHNAVNALRNDIEHLELKDFAYLVRFRLAQEGQGLLDYLEWFFGECLLDGVGRMVDVQLKKDKVMSALDSQGAMRIEGAFDGPTRKVAELFHRVRIENPREKRRKHYRMGDLYLSKNGKDLMAIITPDCDLILRTNGMRNAPRILTVAGKLKKFDAPEASVAEFILVNEKPHNITWIRKEIETKEFGGWPKPGARSKNIKYIGTLRPLYAQELQRSTLSDLGRVGLSIAPALGMTARAHVFLRSKGGALIDSTLASGASAHCYIVPSRGGTDKPLVIFKRTFVSQLIASLVQVDPAKLVAGADKQIEQLKRDNADEKLWKMVTGVSLDKMVNLGIFVTSKNPPQGVDNAWCLIKVEMVDDA